MMYRTGSALLDELATAHDGIMGRMWPGHRARSTIAPRHLALAFAPLPPRPFDKNSGPLSIECRLREVDALRGKVPWDQIRKCIDCIEGSARDLGEAVPRICEPRPRIAFPGKPTIREIQKLVAFHFALTLADILSARRTTKVVLPRQIAMYLSRLLTKRSLPEIGRRFGGRDHSTIIYSIRKISDLIEGTNTAKYSHGPSVPDTALAEEVAALKAMLLG